MVGKWFYRTWPYAPQGWYYVVEIERLGEEIESLTITKEEYANQAIREAVEKKTLEYAQERIKK